MNLSLSARHIQTLRRRRRIINQEDAATPAKILGMDMVQWLRHRFDLMDTEGCQVDTIIWDMGLMADSHAVYRSNILPPVDYYGLAKWCAKNLDWLEIVIDETHKRGLEALWNSRISEVDEPQPFIECSHDDPRRSNYLKKQHPDWTVPCWWPQGLWNLASAELREHKINVFRELLELYDLDGIQLDFARHITIDLTMNVYTHVDMEDLAGDLESLPSFLENSDPKTTNPKATLPESPGLASLTINWSSLPEHIRQAIATLAGG